MLKIHKTETVFYPYKTEDLLMQSSKIEVSCFVKPIIKPNNE